MANKKKKTATTNAGAKSKEQLVIHQIVVKAPQRKVYDVGNWRTALSSADNGRTKQLYDLLDDIMTAFVALPFTCAAMRSRTRSLLSKMRLGRKWRRSQT